MKTGSQLMITFAVILVVLFVVYVTIRDGHHLLDPQRDRTEKVVYH